MREASDRYERRYMEKENKKLREKYVKKERARIIKLSELCYKRDPRVKKYKEEEELEKVIDSTIMVFRKGRSKRSKIERTKRDRIRKTRRRRSSWLSRW